MKGKILFSGVTILCSLALFLALTAGCQKEEEGPAVITVPNNNGPAKLISEIEITQDLETLSVREVGVAHPETGELLSTEATEITSGINYAISGCTATAAPNARTCCTLTITNNTGSTIASVILHGNAAISGSPVAARTGGSGTGYDGSGTDWGNVAASNGGYALWMVTADNTIPNGGTSSRTICIQSPTGYSVSSWRLYKDAILGKIVDRDTGSAITSGGWAMLGMASPDNTSFPELGNGNYTDTDSQGNFGFPYLGTTITSFTITAGATNYARQTIFQTTNRNITLKLKSRTLRGRVALGNYNNTLATVNPNGAFNINSPCTATGNVGCDGYIRIGVLVPAMGYEDIYNLSLEALLGPSQVQNIIAGTGSCGSNVTTLANQKLLPSNIVLPLQNEYPLTIIGYNNAAMTNLSKLEWWVPAPQNTSNATVSAIWGLVAKTAVEALVPAALGGGPIPIDRLVTGINPQCTGWRRNWTTTTTNIQGQTFVINKPNNLSPLVITLQNMPSSTPPRTVIALMGIEATGNPVHQRLFAESIAGGNTTSANISMPSSSNNLAADEAIVPAVLIADLDQRADTQQVDAVIAIADRQPGRQTYSNTTFNTFFAVPTLTWATIQANNRRVAYASPERAIGTAGGSPWVDVGVGIISKTSYINTITEETASCGVGGGCCDKQTASGQCQYDQNGAENLWEFLVRGRTSSTSGPVTDWTIPDLPPAVDLPVGTGGSTGTYPDGNFPSLTAVSASWCPGSSLCTANATTNDFLFDGNDNIDTVLNKTTHFATNKFGLGEARIVTPANQTNIGAATSFTLNGFVTARNWDMVNCDYVFIKIWETYASGTSKVTECGGTPTGFYCCGTAGGCVCTPTGGCTATACSSTTPFCCPQNNVCGFAAINSAGGCGASLPAHCFGSITVPMATAGRFKHIDIDPISSTNNTTCGPGSGEWYVLK